MWCFHKGVTAIYDRNCGAFLPFKSRAVILLDTPVFKGKKRNCRHGVYSGVSTNSIVAAEEFRVQVRKINVNTYCLCIAICFDISYARILTLPLIIWGKRR